MSEEIKDKTTNPVTTGGMFSITAKTTSNNSDPIPAPKKLEKPTKTFPNGYSFPIAKLVNVVDNPEHKNKKEEVNAVISFIFKDPKGKQHTHMEREIPESDSKFILKRDGLLSRIKDIYVSVFGSWPANKVLGGTATTFAELFKEVADDFNAQKNAEGKKLYSITPVFLKLTYYQTYLNFPIYSKVFSYSMKY